MPKGEAHVHLAAGIVLISSARQIDLEFVGTALLGHAPLRCMQARSSQSNEGWLM